MLLPRWHVSTTAAQGRFNGLLGAARGLSTEDVSEVERALSDAVPLSDVDFGLSGSEARDLWPANWLAMVDGIVNAAELATCAGSPPSSISAPS